MPIQVIKARTRTKASTSDNMVQGTKKSVAAYCRVSTDSEEQESSYEVQVRHYTDYINSNPDWTLAGIYADEGISGTSTKNRTQFNQMISDCEDGKIDMVITKSISRWARNTVDSLNNIRKLKDLGIPVYFEKEAINTMDARGEVLITIMSSLAQQESDSISRNVRIGIQYHMQQGKRNFNSGHLLGFKKDETGQTVIVREEADLVRRIYREYLSGHSPGMIADHLTAEHIPSPSGKETWYQSTVNSVLTNEKYCGDFLMQKYYVKDFLSHKLVKNNGQMPQYLVEGDHDPIVPKEVYFQVQGEMQRRSLLKNDPSKIRYGSTMALSGRLFCGLCGRNLKRYVNADHPEKTDWRCRRRAYKQKETYQKNHETCKCRNARESEVKGAVVTAFNRLPEYRDELLRQQGALRDGEIKRIDQSLTSIRDQEKRLEERLENAGQEEGEFLENEINRLSQDENKLLLERADASNKEMTTRMLLELLDFLTCGNSCVGEDNIDKEQNASCSDYEDFFRRTRYKPDAGVIRDGRVQYFSDEMVIRFLDRIIVKNDCYEVRFKAGITINVAVEK